MQTCQNGTFAKSKGQNDLLKLAEIKELGMTLVPIKIDDDLQYENSKLRALISNNFGRRKNDPIKDRKALATYVELKGYKHGEMGNGRKKTCQNGTSTLDEIAKELNMSKRNLQRALRIERNLTDSMKELLDISNKIKYRSPRNRTTSMM